MVSDYGFSAHDAVLLLGQVAEARCTPSPPGYSASASSSSATSGRSLLKFPDKDRAMEKILDLTMLSNIFPTGYHGAYTAGVTSGSTVYVAGSRAGRPGGRRTRRSCSAPPS